MAWVWPTRTSAPPTANPAGRYKDGYLELSLIRDYQNRVPLFPLAQKVVRWRSRANMAVLPMSGYLGMNPTEVEREMKAEPSPVFASL